MNETKAKRVALIFGGTGGIGKGIVEKLGREGYQIALHYSKNQRQAEGILQDIPENGIENMAIGGDITDEESIIKVFQAVKDHFGGIDVVINTAGIMTLSPISDLSLAELDNLYQINFRGAFIVAKQAAQTVRTGGAIINFSTSVTRTQFPNYGAYVATKAAVESMTLILAKELRGKDITVNAVAPGPTATPLFLDGKTPEAIAGLAQSTPLERLGQPTDIAETVAFLAGSARWVNGQVIFTNGGLA